VPMIPIVIVTYNSREVLADCLGSLPAGCHGVDVPLVVVVDNASRDDTETVARAADSAELPVRVVQLGRNAGYAAGINAGIAAVSGCIPDATPDGGPDAVLVLNPDTRLHPGAVAALFRALAAPGRGIAVPRMVYPDGRWQPTLRREPSLVSAVGEAVLGGARASHLGRLGETIADPSRYERPGPAPWATGAAMLLSWSMVEDIGPWDESFLLYSEETEFALRAADRGWTLWYEPAAVVQHAEGESRTSPMLWALLTVNKVRLYRRRHGRLAGTAFHLVVTAGQAVRAMLGQRRARAAVTVLLRPSRRLRVLPS
jgi:N-acetylglucosaminyl-diphospho-decaprenol L-rhamnosyltransferase